MRPMRQLRREDIYDCLDDDEAFARLPGLVATAIGARSAVFHWRSEEGGPLVLADSGYWSPSQMDQYVDRYAAHDIWAQSTLTARTANRLWVIDELVPERVYGNSVFYNDWIRLMGDDTYHCAGMSMAGTAGTGLIGLHRAKAAGAFEADDLARLHEHIGPIRRLMRVRGMLAEARADTRMAGEMLDGLAIAAVVVRREGWILHANAAAQAKLSAGRPVTVAGGWLTAQDAGAAGAIRTAIARATDPAAPESGAVRIAGPDGASEVVTVAPIRRDSHRCALLLFRAAPPPSAATQLQRLFRLTAAEAAVALCLAQGMSPTEIATQREVSPLTIRTQLKVVAEKLGCRRQTEIVALITRIEPVLGG